MNDTNEATTIKAAQRARRELERSLSPLGMCHSCESPLPAGRVFCDDLCADDLLQRRQAREKEVQR